MTKKDEFQDLESVYDEKIAPLMSQIIEICKAHEMPVLATFRYAEDGMCTTNLPFGKRATKAMSRAAEEILRGDDAITLAETHAARPDGTRAISIRRVT